ncbi:MAG: M56 family metallopeptidase [Verrucomicrobiota bacterium]
MTAIDFITEYALRSSLLLLISLIFMIAARKLSLSPNFSHKLGMIAILFILLMPILQHPHLQWEILPQYASLSNQTPPSLITPAPHHSSSFTSLSENIPNPDHFSPPLITIPAYTIVLTIWLLGALSYLTYYAAGILLFARLTKKSKPAPTAFKKTFEQLLLQNHHSQKISLVLASGINTPFTGGFLRPAIVLPHNSIQWSPEQLRLVLLHELAHVSRHDILSLFLSKILLSIHWFNPIAWALCRKLDTLCEEACDQLVLHAGSCPVQYAEFLVRMARPDLPDRTFSLAISKTHTLETRIKNIMKTPEKNLPTRLYNTSITVLFSALALFVSTLAIAKQNSGKDQLAQLHEDKLESIIIPLIEFADTSLPDAINFIVHRSRELDTSEKNPADKGVNIISYQALSDVKLTLRLSNIPLGEALRVIADLADADLKKMPHAIALVPQNFHTSVVKEKESSAIQNKLKNIILPSVEFKGTPINDALAYLQQRSVDLDSQSPVNQKGINLVLKKSKDDKKITLNLRNISLGEVLLITAQTANYEMQIRPHSILLTKAKP